MSEWVAIALTILGSGWSLVVSYGYNRRRMEELEKELVRSFKYHTEHYQHAKDDQVHFQDMEKHWSSRERDDLNKRLDKIDAKLDTLLER